MGHDSSTRPTIIRYQVHVFILVYCTANDYFSDFYLLLQGMQTSRTHAVEAAAGRAESEFATGRKADTALLSSVYKRYGKLQRKKETKL